MLELHQNGENFILLNRFTRTLNNFLIYLKIGELKSKVGLLEAHIQEQSEELSAARERANIAISKMSALDTELKSKGSKLEDLETREEKYGKIITP